MERKPESKHGSPIWWNKHGWKMRVRECYTRPRYSSLTKGDDTKPNHLMIKGDAATVTIDEDYLRPGYFIEWEIMRDFSFKLQTGGRIHLSAWDLARAFGLNDTNDPEGSWYWDWLVRDYGATTGLQGYYVRDRNYLNIPCPGTGRDGDPNVSIRLSKEIKEAVKSIIPDFEHLFGE